MAVGREVGDAAAAGDGHQEAGHASLVDVVGQVLVEAVQRLRIQPDLTRVDFLPQLCHRSPPLAFVEVRCGIPRRDDLRHHRRAGSTERLPG